MKKIFVLFFSTLLIFAFADETETVKKLQAFSVIGDNDLAIQASLEALEAYPHSKPLYLQAIKILAHAGQEEKMMQVFRSYQTHYPEDAYPRDLLEEMAWGVIQKGSKASAPLTRAIALIAAAMGNDARGVELLTVSLKDQNRLIRALSIEFSSHFRDAKLQNGIIERLKNEQDIAVRVELLGAVGKMKIEAAEPYLLKVLENERSLAEEKAAAIESMVELHEVVDQKEIERFAKHPRAGLRALASAAISYNDRKEDAYLLIPLLKDPQADVRKAALEALGDLRVESIQEVPVSELISPLTKDKDVEVAMTAAWVMMLNRPKEGQALLYPWLMSTIPEERLLASAILAGAGKYGFPLTEQAFYITNDPYVKLNLALTLIRQRVCCDQGASALYQLIKNQKERWMTKDFGRFSAVGPCDVSHRPDIPNYPEAVNQTTRLEILNELAMLHHPGAEKAIQSFLNERPWGVSGAASALLLTEGGDEALDLIRNLLKDPSDKIRLQAALILGLWGSDPEALTTLQTLYPTVNRQQKEQILEALGRIGELSSLPFLVDRLEEQYQILRMVGAVAILLSLYH